jgi:hypothetical protein
LLFLSVLVEHDRESFLRLAPEVDHSTVYMEFDYLQGPVRIRILPIEQYVIPADPFLNLRWQDLRARMARSLIMGGLGIDVMLLPHGQILQLGRR